MRTLGTFLAGSLLLLPLILNAQEYDRFGGFKGIRGEKTGRWYTGELNGRQWFITPEGNAWYCIGINHISGSTEEEKVTALANLHDWNFNSAGYGAPAWIRDRMPYFAQVTLHSAVHWLPASRFAFTDVFSREFAELVRETIRAACTAHSDNANCVGYSMTDTPRYDLDINRSRRGTDWVSFIRSLDGEAAGKRIYIDFLRERHGKDFALIKARYRLEDKESYEELYDYDFAYLELTREHVRSDDKAFLLEIAERIYSLTRTAFDEFDPGALVLSEKFKMHDHTDGIIRIAGKYTDVISVQPGPTAGPDAGQGPDESDWDQRYWEKLHELSGKPVFICDHATTFRTSGYPRTLWHQFLTESEAAAHYDWYLHQTMKEPYMLGYQRCQYKSRYDPLRTLLKQGLLDLEGKPYDVLADQVRRTNQKIFEKVYR